MTSDRRWIPRATFVGGLFVTIALYWSNLSGGYLSDDFSWAVRVRTGGPTAIFTTHWPFFRPQVGFEFWLLDKLAGGQPWLLRTVSLACLLAGSVLVWRIVLLLAAATDNAWRAEWLATLAGLIFAFFPSHSEPVNWVCCWGDTAGTAEALAAVLLYFRYLQANGTRKPIYFVGAILFAALAMTAKESFVALPTLLILFDFVLGKRDSLKASLLRVLPLFIVDVALVAIYLWAHNALHNGWGYSGQLSAGRNSVVANLSLDVPNTFLPFTKWMALFREDLILWPVWLLALAFAATILRRCGPSRPPANSTLGRIYRWGSEHKQPLLLVWAVGLVLIGYFGISDIATQAEAGLIAVLFGAAAWRYKLYRFGWLTTILFLVGSFGLVGHEDLLLNEYLGLSGGFLVFKGKLASAMILLYAFVTRPGKYPMSAVDRRRLVVAFAFFATSMLLLLPAMGVPWVNVNGQAERLAYESSPFSAMMIAALLGFALRGRARWLLLAGGVPLALFAAVLFFSNCEWAYAGLVSRNVARDLGPLVAAHPRRIYLISGVAFTGEAQLYNQGEDLFLKVAYPNSNTAILEGYQELNHLPGDRVVLSLSDPAHGHFRLQVEQHPYKFRLAPDTIGARGTGFAPEYRWYRAGEPGELWLNGFEPGDRIAFVEGDHLKVLR